MAGFGQATSSLPVLFVLGMVWFSLFVASITPKGN